MNLKLIKQIWRHFQYFLVNGTTLITEPFTGWLFNVYIDSNITNVVPSLYSCINTLVFPVTGMGDLTFDLNAYTFGIMSVFAQALYLTTVQSVGLQHDAFSAVDIMYLNSINCILPLTFCTTLSSEFTQVLEFPHLSSPRFLLIYLIVISMGCALNYAIFLCTVVTSALTTSVVGVIKSIAVVIVGLFTFGGLPLTVSGVFGIAMNTLGSGWYTYDKYRAKSEDKEDMESVCSTQESDSLLKAGEKNIIMNGHAHSGIK